MPSTERRLGPGLPWIGTSALVLVAAWLALLGIGVVSTVAFSNGDARGFAGLSLYVVALVIVPGAVAHRAIRRDLPLRRTIHRTAVAILLVHLPLLPVVVAAMAM